MILTDPRDAGPGPRNAVERWFVTRLRDPRDLALVRVAAFLSVCTVVPAVLFYAGLVPAWAAVIWWPILFAKHAGRYTLLLHVTAHRPVFKREHRWMEPYFGWVLGPFFGHTPTSFHTHHVGMHHPEENLSDDLSSTLHHQRDRLGAFFRYWARFFFLGTSDLVRYLRQRRRHKLARRFLVGEAVWLGAMLVLLALAPGPTIAVFLGPFFLIRFFMMVGNWAQHSFVDVSDPGNAYRHSTCLVNARYNHICFNDGYHIVHHLRPAMHWTEMPAWFEAHLEDFGRNDAVVFSGIPNNQVVWWWVMTGQWERLADHVVALPGAPVRTREERVAWLQERVRRDVPRPVPAAGAVQPAG